MEGRRADSDGRFALSQREYYALRQLFGFAAAFSCEKSELKKRITTVPDGEKDAKDICDISHRLIKNILRTVPLKKLNQIMRELNNTRVVVEVKRSVCPETDDNLTYVPQRALERITRKAVEIECFCCEKSAADIKKCQLRKDIESTYMFEYPSKENECPFAGMTIGGSNANEEQ